MTKPNVNKTNIAIGTRYKDRRTKLKYRAKEYLPNFKQIRMENTSKVSVIFYVDVCELYFIQI